EHAEADFEARPTAEWLAIYRPYLDDVRVALDWAFSPRGDAGVGVALTAAAMPLWMHLSLAAECRGRAEQAIANIGRQVAGDPRGDMQLYLALANANLHTDGDRQEMNAALTKALELAEIMNDTPCQLGAIQGLYVHRLTAGDYRGALSLGEKFHTIAAESADRSDGARGSGPVGLALPILGDQPGARRHLEPLAGGRFPAVRASHVVLYQFDQRVVIDCYYARALWLQALSDQAARATE